MVRKEWKSKPIGPEADKLGSELGMSAWAAQVLVNRGITEVEEGRQFLHCGLQHLHSPWLLDGMDVVVERVSQALDGGERVVIYGDYDVDGQTASALLVRVLRQLAHDPDQVQFYIPNRMEEGYGLHREAIDELASRCDLVITVDCGISAIDEAEYARSLDLDLVITDHHEPQDVLPRAVGVLNPKLKGSGYPFSHLCGVGVAYKLVQALGERYQQDFSVCLDLVALGTVADLVPLVGENRVFVRYGLQQLQQTEWVGLRALVEVSGVRGQPDAGDLGYRLGPRLNAAGRMGEPARGVRLLLSDDKVEAVTMAKALDQENRVRQATEKEICAQAQDMVTQRGWEQEPVLVVASEQWHPGVIGIVASRLVERYYRPTVVISLQDGVGKGSARSIAGFHFFKALQACQSILERYGGHEKAAGLTVLANRIDALRQTLGSVAKQQLQPEDYIPKISLDAQLSLDAVDREFDEDLTLLAPFGMGNPAPLFQVQGSVVGTRVLGRDGTHVQAVIQDASGQSLELLAFGMRSLLDEYQGSYESMRFAVSPQCGQDGSTQFVVRDMQSAAECSTFVDTWLIDKYPWSLPWRYQQVSWYSLDHAAGTAVGSRSQIQVVDARNTWDRMPYIQETLSVEEKVLFYVPTAQQALELTRQLRIELPGVHTHVGFEHEFLSAAEREIVEARLRTGEMTWVVSTGLHQWAVPWSKVVYYGLPASATLATSLINQLAANGTLYLLYGLKERSFLQGCVQNAYPERNVLAKLYRALSQEKEGVFHQRELETMAEQLQMRPGLRFALDVFAELKLVEMHGQQVILQPKPPHKLDLHSSNVYNDGMQQRTRNLDYVRQCMERGFADEFAG